MGLLDGWNGCLSAAIGRRSWLEGDSVSARGFAFV